MKEAILFLIPYFITLLVGGLGYLIVYYFWEPIRQVNNYKKEIITIITNFANVRKVFEMKKNRDYTGPDELYDEVVLNKDEITQVVRDLRNLSGRLRATINTEVFYSFLSHIKLIPKKTKIENISKILIGWSNSFGQENQSRLIGDYINSLAKILNIPIY